MNRKKFLSGILAMSAVPAFASGAPPAPNAPSASAPNPPSPDCADPLPLLIPPFLRPGDTIGITCPAGDITAKEIQPSVELLESWGFHIRIGDTVGKKDFIFGGTDDERAADLQQMLADPGLGAILCARGGYGSVHLIDRLDFSPLQTHPKWIIGFSDITVILCHLHANLNLVSIHSKMCNSFPDDWSKAEPMQAQSILSIRSALTGEKMQYDAPAARSSAATLRPSRRWPAPARTSIPPGRSCL
jgi:muramoyltetrapeptide carboxypeptidase